jgi:glycosyltransferase involved in cell wall biosynthesis
MMVVIVRAALETVSPRGPKTAQVLSSHGHNVILLGWDRECKYPKVSREEHYEAHRFRFRAPFGPRVIALLPIWWTFEFLWLIRHKWDVVQAMDFDTIMPALIAAKFKRKKVVYDIVDLYYEMIRLPLWLTRFCIFVDKIFLRLADGVLLASEGYERELRGIPNKNMAVIYNSPPDILKGKESATSSGVFTLFYAGAIFKARRANVDRVIEAIKDIDDIRMVVAGFGDQAAEIEKLAVESEGKLQFVGRIGYVDVLRRSLAADLLFALYEPSVYVHKVNHPTKLFEAMMCHKPILVSKGTATADLVEKERCGLVVDCSSVDEIRQAIIKLKDDPELCNVLGANGRKACEQRYSWQIMEQRLLSLYSAIVSKC